MWTSWKISGPKVAIMDVLDACLHVVEANWGKN